jgi:HlyD family secretion protein
MSEVKKGSKNIFRITVLFITLLSMSLIFGWFYLGQSKSQPEIIELSGRIESDDATVAAKVSGRIREINVGEGDLVKAGQVIAILEDEQLKAREQQAQSIVLQAEAKLMQAQQQIAVLQAEHQESHLSVNQAKIDAQGRVSQAESLVAAAEANLAQAKAIYQQALYDEEKFTALVASGDMPAREGKQAKTATETQKAVVDAATKQVEAARGALLAVKANLDNPAIRSAQVLAIEQQIRQAQSNIHAAEAEVARAKAQLQEAEANHKDLEVVAPFDGTVATRMVEPGEVVGMGTPIISLVNFNVVYLRGFIPEGEIGRVKNGQPARVYLDSNPKQPLEAVVTRIDPEASFTPENTYFRDDRVKQVVGVKLLLTNPQGFAKPGMPADGQVLVEGNQWVSVNKE